MPLSPQAAADEDDRNFADVAVWHFADLQGPSSDVLMTIAVISRVAVLSVRSSGGEVLHPSRELRRLEVSALVRSAGGMRVREIR